MDISIEVVCCLDITEICKPRFSGASCFYICRLDPHVCYDVVGEKQENFVSYFICIQCWSLANQNKTFLSLQLFCCCCCCCCFFFMSMFFQKSIRLDSRGSLLSKSNIIILKNLLNGSKVYEIYFLGISKNIFKTSIFLSTSEGLFLIISGIRSSTSMKFFIFHFSLLLFIGGCFLKRLFTYWLRIHKLCLRTRVALQILSHKARHKIPMKYLISLYTHLYFHANVYAFSYIIFIHLQKVVLAL